MTRENGLVLAETTPYIRKAYEYSVADQWGAFVAHQDIIRAVLRHESVDAVHLFIEHQPPGVLAKNYARAGLRQLQDEFGRHRVDFKKVRDLHQLARQNPYVFIVAGPPYHRLSQTRDALGISYPLCCIVHSVPTARSLPNYLITALVNRPYDALVVTSTAGRRAVESLLDCARDYIRERTQTSLTFQPEIVQIPLGVDTESLHPIDKNTSRKILGIPDHKFLFLYVGRVTESFKADLEPLLVVLRQLSDDLPDVTLLIAGREHEEMYSQHLRRLAEEMGVINRCQFMMNFPHFLKPVLYSAADIFVSPVDNIQETFGLAVIEAMACGLPVVVSDWSGYRDIVVHGETGYLVRTLWDNDAGSEASRLGMAYYNEYAEHLLAQRTIIDTAQLYEHLLLLASRPDLRLRFGENGRKRALTLFSWEVVTRQLAELWRHQRVVMKSLEANPGDVSADYNKAFAHYSTGVFDSSMRVTSTGLPPDIAITLLRRRGPMYVEMNQSLILDVLRQCEGCAPSITEISDALGPESVLGVKWLLKKGLLRLKSEEAETGNIDLNI